MSTENPTALVTGATGRVGRHVVDGLLELGVDVRALTRDPRRADLPGSVDLRPGDPRDPSAVAAAAQGADAAFWLWAGFDPTGSEEPMRELGRHVQHVAVLSAADLTGDTFDVQPGVWAEQERHAADHVASWSFVRAGGFAANTLGWADQIRGGRLALPVPDAVRSPVHERDIAAVAVQVLVDPQHRGQSYAVTGPQQVSLREQAQTIASVVGVDLEVVGQSRDEALAEMAAFGDAEMAESSLAHWERLVDHPERVSGDVATVTGRPALDFARWAAEHRDDFA